MKYTKEINQKRKKNCVFHSGPTSDLRSPRKFSRLVSLNSFQFSILSLIIFSPQPACTTSSAVLPRMRHRDNSRKFTLKTLRRRRVSLQSSTKDVLTQLCSMLIRRSVDVHSMPDREINTNITFSFPPSTFSR